MKMRLYTAFFVVLVMLGTGCSSNNNKSAEKKDDILTGALSVCVDETILPLFLEQKEVFENSYYDSKIKALPNPETKAVNSLLKGDADIAFLTRELSKEELKNFEDKSIKGRVYPVAYDGIVILANAQDRDTSVVVEEVLAHLKGQGNPRWKKLVFDNLNSSVLRYLMDYGKIQKIASTYVEAKNSSLEVLQEVSNSSGKIGFISFNQFLSLKSSFPEMNKIRILSVLNEKDGVKKFVLPSQATLSTDEYPLKRTIFMLNYQPNMGLGIGFSAFMTGDRGQRIVLKSGLLPAKMPGREIIIRDRIE